MSEVRFIDFAKTFVKPADADVFGVYAVLPNLQQGLEYGTFKSFFVRTDEDHDINASHEYQSGDSLSWGSAGEFKIYSNGVDAFINSKSGIKQRYQVGGIDFVVFDGTNNSVKFGDRALNYTGAAGAGIVFESSNSPTIETTLKLIGGGISTGTKNISRGGVDNTGLEFEADNTGVFRQNLDVLGELNISGQSTFSARLNVNADIALKKGEYINNTGSPTWGITFDNTSIGNEYTEVKQKLVVSGELNPTGTLRLGPFGDIQGGASGDCIAVNGNIKAGTGKRFAVGGVNGITQVIDLTSATSITVTGGIITSVT